MILLFLLLALHALCLDASVVEVERKKNVKANDEVKFASGRYLLTDDEMKKIKDILDKRNYNAYTIEVMIMLDYSIYNWWLQIYKTQSKTESALKAYYAHMFLKIKMRYNLLKIKGKKYDLKVVGIEIAKTKTEVPFVESQYKVNTNAVDSYTVLLNLTNWLKDHRNKFPRYDVFALFTKYDMGIFNGLAWPEAACSEHGVSVTREMGFYDTYHSACHEIGHNLGSHHDDASGCTYDDQYIMAAGTEYFRNANFKKRHLFSPCSKDYFDKYITRMDTESGNCLVLDSSKRSLALGTYASKRLGEMFNVDKQCQIIMGANSFFCAGGDDNVKNMCREITCWNATDNKCFKGPKAAPGDGTPCESKKSCQDEDCKNDPTIKSGKVGCYFGDWKGKLLGEHNQHIKCSDVKSKTYLCYMKDIALACCDTCQKVYKPEKKGCEYGDQGRGCSKSKCSYQSTAECCRTCERNASDPCQFGDKAGWCKGIKKSECYINEDVCCKTCKKYEDKTKKECRYGDSRNSCPTETKSLPKRCLDEKFQKDCCVSCEFIKAKKCMDLDPAYCKTIRPYFCYKNVEAQQLCCKTCKSFEKKDAPKGCKYGDHNDNCNQSYCKGNKDTCCYTCKTNNKG